MELPMKRVREETEIDTANCLMLLSKIGQTDLITDSYFTGRTFTCKTCNKKFPSFQALGGHRASHKKPKLLGDDLFFKLANSPPKPKTHECSICGLEFPIGQALGGHMRRHRAVTTTTNNTNKDNSNDYVITRNTTPSATSNSSMESNGEELATRDIFPVVGLRKKSSCRIFGVDISVVTSSTLDMFV